VVGSLASADFAASIVVGGTLLASSGRAAVARGIPAFWLSEPFQNCHLRAKDQKEVAGEEALKLGLANAVVGRRERPGGPTRASNC